MIIKLNNTIINKPNSSNMKHLIWILLFVIFAFGCGNKQKRIEEQQRLDSIAKIEKAMLDSI